MTGDAVPQEQRNGDPQQLGLPLQGEITRVTGRRGTGGGAGLPAIDQFSFSLPDGTIRDFGSPVCGESASATVLAEIHAASFLRQPGSIPICPICLDAAPSHKEHVPQADLGGAVMTMTCQRCNNDLGSRVEVDLQHWFDHALVDVRFDHDGEVPGRRRLPTLHYRATADGSEFALIVDGEIDPAVRQMMTSGEWRMHYREPDPQRYKVALLKHSYLAACMYLGGVPNTPDAQAIRADLVVARDTPRSASPPASDHAERLHVYRSGVGKQGPPLALVAQRDADEAANPEFLISLSGSVAVSWPFTDLPPGS